MDIGQKPMENPVANKMCVLVRCKLHKRRARGVPAEKPSKFRLNAIEKQVKRD
jgi:hypothetical protein